METAENVAQSQIATEVASRLRDLTSLESVHVISMDRIGFEGPVEQEFGHPPFSERLGALAARQIAYELAFSMVMKWKQGDLNVPFRIGVAAGSTVRAIVEAFSFPPQFRDKLRDTRLTVEVAPLTIGPIPETASSAGFIANSLCRKLSQSLPSVEFVPLTEKSPESDGYRLKMKDDLRSARDKDPFDLTRENSAQSKIELKKSPLRFDWILTGVGSINSGQLVEHLKLRFPSDDNRSDIYAKAVGDICSRIFTKGGTEILQSDGDKFVGISFDWLAYLANAKSHGRRHNRVVAVTGGEEKYTAILSLMKNTLREPPVGNQRRIRCLFNSLFTDELTVRLLLDDLGREARIRREARQRSARDFD